MIRIAIRMLMGDLIKWMGVVLGVFFCTFLITHLLSMFNAMLERTYATISDIPQADVWVMDPSTEYVDETSGMPPTALDRVRGVSGVEWASPLIQNSVRARLPHGLFRAVTIIGVVVIEAPGPSPDPGVLRHQGPASSWASTAMESSASASACTSTLPHA
jgi:putative ABC transport system permease protein